jgi:hypothetical protein
MNEKHTREWYEGRIELLDYLHEVAAKTPGAENWRALFAEGRRAEKLERNADLKAQRAHETKDQLFPDSNQAPTTKKDVQ